MNKELLLMLAKTLNGFSPTTPGETQRHLNYVIGVLLDTYLGTYSEEKAVQLIQEISKQFQDIQNNA